MSITYTPGQVPDDPARLVEFLRLELQQLKLATERAQPFMRLRLTTMEPLKYAEGDIYEARAPWNPGAGNGCYIRRGGAWVLLG